MRHGGQSDKKPILFARSKRTLAKRRIIWQRMNSPGEDYFPLIQPSV